MNELNLQPATVQDSLLRVLRVVWVGFALFVVWAVLRGALARFWELSTISDDAAQFVGQLTPTDARQLANLGLGARQFAAYFTVAETATALMFVAMGGLIFLRRPREWFALYAATFFSLAAAVLPIGSALPRCGSLDPIVVRATQVAFSICFVTFSFFFPDGTAVPHWSLGVAVIALEFDSAVRRSRLGDRKVTHTARAERRHQGRVRLSGECWFGRCESHNADL